jgi:hypothetical protein
MAKGLPANHHPADASTALLPRLIELCLQAAGLWELKVQGRLGLPRHIHKLSFWGTLDRAEGRLYAVVTADPVQNSFEVEALDETGKRYVCVSGYRTEAFTDMLEAPPKKMQAVA